MVVHRLDVIAVDPPGDEYVIRSCAEHMVLHHPQLGIGGVDECILIIHKIVHDLLMAGPDVMRFADGLVEEIHLGGDGTDDRYD